MSDRLDNLTLRQKLSEADKLVRELIHHLEHGFVPKAHNLRRISRQGGDNEEFSDVTDMTIRASVDDLLESDLFTRRVSTQLNQFLAMINTDVQRVQEIH